MIAFQETLALLEWASQARMRSKEVVIMQQYFSNSRFGQKISNLRRQLNWTQGELAEQLGVSHQAVSSWEKGQARAAKDLAQFL